MILMLLSKNIYVKSLVCCLLYTAAKLKLIGAIYLLHSETKVAGRRVRACRQGMDLALFKRNVSYRVSSFLNQLCLVTLYLIYDYQARQGIVY